MLVGHAGVIRPDGELRVAFQRDAAGRHPVELKDGGQFRQASMLDVSTCVQQESVVFATNRSALTLPVVPMDCLQREQIDGAQTNTWHTPAPGTRMQQKLLFWGLEARLNTQRTLFLSPLSALRSKLVSTLAAWWWPLAALAMVGARAGLDLLLAPLPVPLLCVPSSSLASRFGTCEASASAPSSG